MKKVQSWFRGPGSLSLVVLATAASGCPKEPWQEPDGGVAPDVWETGDGAVADVPERPDAGADAEVLDPRSLGLRFGVCAPDGSQVLHRYLDFVRELGFRGPIRTDLIPLLVHPAPDSFDFSDFESYVRDATALGLEILPILGGGVGPGWGGRSACFGNAPPCRLQGPEPLVFDTGQAEIGHPVIDHFEFLSDDPDLTVYLMFADYEFDISEAWPEEFEWLFDGALTVPADSRIQEGQTVYLRYADESGQWHASEPQVVAGGSFQPDFSPFRVLTLQVTSAPTYCPAGMDCPADYEADFGETCQLRRTPGGRLPADGTVYATYAVLWPEPLIETGLEAIRRYGAGLAGVEVWNEPDYAFWKPVPNPRLYALLFDAVFRALKGARPDLLVLSGGVTTYGLPFLEEAFAHMETTPDAVALHWYAATVDFPGHVARAEEMVQNRFGRPLPLWITETGVSTSDEDFRAEEAPRLLAYEFAQEHVDHVLYFSMFGPNDTDHNGLVDRNTGRAHPAYTAVQTLLGQLGSCWFETLDLLAGDQVAHLRFDCPDRRVHFLARVAQGDPIPVSLTLDATQVTFSDYLGQSRTLSSQTGVFTFQVPYAPLYVSAPR